jgi:hypothetical protein
MHILPKPSIFKHDMKMRRETNKGLKRDRLKRIFKFRYSSKRNFGVKNDA